MSRDFRRKKAQSMVAAACALIGAYVPVQVFAQAVTCNATSGKSVPAIVELYTSEGCNSCPPADRWLSKLVAKPDAATRMIALAFHVDYWDYIGWRDVYARAEYGVRHSALVRANGSTTVYTPQIFVNGRDDRTWRMELTQFEATPSRASLEVTADWADGRLAFRGRVVEGDAVRIRYAVAQNGIVTNVKRGENAGEMLKQDAVVRDHAIMNLAADKSFSVNTRLASDVQREKSVLHVIAENAKGEAVAAATLRCSG